VKCEAGLNKCNCTPRSVIGCLVEYVVVEIDHLVNQLSNRLLAVGEEDPQAEFRRI